MLKLTDIHAFYGDAHVLHGVSLTVGSDETVCIMGPNGAGKSTLLKVIAGALRPRRGAVEWEGRNLTGRHPKEAVAAGIVLVPEGRRIFTSLTVRENLVLGAYSRRDSSAIDSDFELMYDIFPILAERRNNLGKQLSGGQQQMLAIARGLMSRPRLLLLDEPSLGLAPRIVGDLPGVLSRIREVFATAVLIVEQNASLALGIANRGVLMETGRIRLSGTRDELREVLDREGPFVHAAS